MGVNSQGVRVKECEPVISSKHVGGFGAKKQHINPPYQSGGGFFIAAGFPERLLKKVIDKLRMHYVSYVIVHQTGRELQRTKERLPVLMVRYVK